MSDTAKRDAVVERFYAQHYGTMMGAAVLDVLVTNAMADRIVELEAEVDELRQRAERAERILAALRDPSEAVVMMTLQRTGANAIRAAVGAAEIFAAVAAAEQEVGA